MRFPEEDELSLAEGIFASSCEDGEGAMLLRQLPTANLHFSHLGMVKEMGSPQLKAPAFQAFGFESVRTSEHQYAPPHMEVAGSIRHRWVDVQ